MTETSPPPPPGFHLHDRRPSFSTHNGPWYGEANQPHGARNALFAEARHAGADGLVDAGMMCAFLDGAMAQAVTRGTGLFAVTIEASFAFLDGVPPGEWLIAHAVMTGSTRDLAFVDGRVAAGVRELVRATGVFKVVPRP